MKTCTRVIAMLLLFATSALAATPAKSVKWLDDFANAKSEAKKTGKPILVNFTGSDWCPWCIKLDKEVFSQKAFLDYASANLVLAIADFPRGKKLPARVVKQNESLQAKYQIQGFPTVLLLDGEGQLLGQTGYVPGGAEAYVTNIKSLLEKSGWKPPVASNKTEKAEAPSLMAPVAPAAK